MTVMTYTDFEEGPKHLEHKRLQPEEFDALRGDITTYVETGTFWGYQLKFASEAFDRVIGIEIDPSCVQRSREWCADCDNVTVMEGDSTTVLPELVKEIDEPVWFYLDSHYCDNPFQPLTPGPFPLWVELRAILARKQPDIIFIDDVHTWGKPYEGQPEWQYVSKGTLLAFLEPRVMKHEIRKDGMVVWLS